MTTPKAKSSRAKRARKKPARARAGSVRQDPRVAGGDVTAPREPLFPPRGFRPSDFEDDFGAVLFDDEARDPADALRRTIRERLRDAAARQQALDAFDKRESNEARLDALRSISGLARAATPTVSISSEDEARAYEVLRAFSVAIATVDHADADLALLDAGVVSVDDAEHARTRRLNARARVLRAVLDVVPPANRSPTKLVALDGRDRTHESRLEVRTVFESLVRLARERAKYDRASCVLKSDAFRAQCLSSLFAQGSSETLGALQSACLSAVLALHSFRDRVPDALYPPFPFVFLVNHFESAATLDTLFGGRGTHLPITGDPGNSGPSKAAREMAKHLFTRTRFDGVERALGKKMLRN